MERALGRFWLIPVLFWLMLARASAQTDGDRIEIAHTVVAGESLSVIAAAYGVTVDDIATVNGLDPEAILRVGERLVIVFSAVGAEAGEDEPTATPSPEPTERDANPVNRVAIGSMAQENDLPPAPVTAADYPAQDPGRFDAVICLAQYDDENQNGALDPGEAFVGGGSATIMTGDGGHQGDYALDGESQPHCVDGLLARVYIVTVDAPPGYGLTVSESLRVDLRNAVPTPLQFGVKRGLEMAALPADAAPAAVDAPSREEAVLSPLRQLSGLFVLVGAGLVLVCGFLLALFLRLR